MVTAGTSDIPVAEEGAVTAEAMGNRVEAIYDVGVAGLHRLLDHRERLVEARVIICVAGMEGALPSVVGGLVSAPVIAVPTSTGYGASFGGVAALLAMLNSCASNVSVVNIDNGFGAGCVASCINQLDMSRRKACASSQPGQPRSAGGEARSSSSGKTVRRSRTRRSSSMRATTGARLLRAAQAHFEGALRNAAQRARQRVTWGVIRSGVEPPPITEKSVR